MPTRSETAVAAGAGKWNNARHPTRTGIPVVGPAAFAREPVHHRPSQQTPLRKTSPPMNTPSYIAQAARARVDASRAERHTAVKAAREGRPLEAEWDSSRKIRRVQNVMQVGAHEAARLCHEHAAPLLLANAKAKRGMELIQGPTVDFLDVAFLETAVAASRTVARVVYADGRPRGSGFMVSDRLFMTNYHVIDETTVGQLCVEFDYQLNYRGEPVRTTRFALDPTTCFIRSSETELDFTIIAIGARLEGPSSLDEFGYCPLLARDDKHVLGELVNVIQHPEGNYKQAVIRENRLVTRLPTVLHYVADTMPGSSGSPVFNDQWEAVALHHWGEPYTEIVDGNGNLVRHDVNEGVRISAILQSLTARRATLDARGRTLIDAVLQPPVQFISTLRDVARPESGGRTAAGGDSGQPVVSADGVATWTIPLRVSVNLGSSAASPSTPPPAPAADSAVAPASTDGGGIPEAVEIDPNYRNRQGYRPRFLKGFEVPLPQLPAEAQPAPVSVHGASGPSHELKYTHFSIVMNAARRMAYYTACNIDGSSWKNIDRKTGIISEAAEATEKWFTDPRIPAAAQTDQPLYDAQRPRRLFDRGHLVRRQDPSWGPDIRAYRANADTFHFTNCTPQASTFNQRAKHWQGIEQYILEDNAVADGDKVTVFTGPVFADDDPPYRDIKVPRQFWKIIVRVDAGTPAVVALLASQSQFLNKLPEALRSEAWDDTAKVEEFLSTVREIEKLTGLDFGNLRDYDVRGGPESIRTSISGFESIPLAPKRSATGEVLGGSTAEVRRLDDKKEPAAGRR